MRWCDVNFIGHCHTLLAQWHPLVSGAFTSWAKSSEKERCTFWASNISHTHTNVWTNVPSGCQNCVTEQHPPWTLMVGNQEISFMELERSLLC
jgi:hypothetical protein